MPIILSVLQIKVLLEGGNKRLLNQAIEKLWNHVASNWIDGSNIVEILRIFEDVTLSEPANFDKSIKKETMFLIWKKIVACYVDKFELFRYTKKALYNILW